MAVSNGLQRTLACLTETTNTAAVRLLVVALDSPDPEMWEGALLALLRRRDAAGHREVLRRLHQLDASRQTLLREHRGRLTPAIRSAILSADAQTCINGCQAAVWFEEYELIPALVTALENPAHPHADLLGETLRVLTQRMYADLASGERSGGCDPLRLRGPVVSALEKAVLRYARHRRPVLVESFLLLVSRDNAMLNRLVQDTYHPAFPVVLEALANRSEAGVIRLLMSFLDDARAPASVLSIIAKRSDLRFVQYWLRKVGREPSRVVAQNLRRMNTIPWLHGGESLLDELDDAQQHAAVRLAVLSGIPRAQAFSVLEHLLLRGKPAGRRAAAEALAQFQGAQANALALRALDDPDGEVQAVVLVQLRSRGIPGALTRLVDLLDSPFPVVRKAARRSLSEFTCRRFLAAWDMLDEEVRRSTGELVRKVDRQAAAILRAELKSPMRGRRLRAMAVARTIGLVAELETAIIALLHDDDHVIRAEAATCLAETASAASHEALQEALSDRSSTVQDAAQKSLQRRGQLGPESVLPPNLPVPTPEAAV